MDTQAKKTWFVTGASKGMGLALVKALIAKGEKVAATSRNAAELEKHFPGNANLLALTVDITVEHEVKSALHKTVDRFGRLDVIVNNAGYMLLGSLEEISAAEFQQSMNVNVNAALHVIRHGLYYLRAQRSGYILNFASIAGYYGAGSAGSYNAVKFAMIGLSEALAEEVKDFGIKVTVIAPGLFRTSFLDKGGFAVAQNKIEGYHTLQLETAMKQINGNQPGDPHKLVDIMINLANEKNPPVHLIVGPDAVDRLAQIRKAEDEEVNTWKRVSISTNI